MAHAPHESRDHDNHPGADRDHGTIQENQYTTQTPEEKGWSEYRTTDTHTSYRRYSYGSKKRHAILAVATAWWLVFIPNILYMMHTYYSSSEYLVIDNQDGSTFENMGLCRNCEDPTDAGAWTCDECEFAPKRQVATAGGILLMGGAFLTFVFPIVGLPVLAIGLLMCCFAPFPKPIH